MRALVIAVVVAGCGDQVHEPSVVAETSGLDPALMLGQLDPVQADRLCEWQLAELGGAGHTESCSECSDGSCIDWDVTVNTLAQCTAQLGDLARCSVTVATFEACANAQKVDLCASPEACRPLDGCS